MMDILRWAWYTVRRCIWKPYWKLQVEGLQNLPEGAYLLCANHASHLDASAILAALPRSEALRVRTAAAKDVFADRPFYNFFAQLFTHALPIERGASFARGLRELEAVLKSGRPLILFPEGRRSPNGDLLEFKPGAAMLARRAGVPIVPVCLKGVRQALPRGATWFSPAPMRVIFGKPIQAGADDRETIAQVKSAIASADLPSRTRSEGRSAAARA